MTEILGDEGFIGYAQQRVQNIYPAEPYVRKVLSLWEALRQEDIEANPCLNCQHKDCCTHGCRIHRAYVNQDGVYSKSCSKRAAAYQNLTEREQILFDDIREGNTI